jgi:hypothetical protein
MTSFLDRVSTVPMQGEGFSFTFESWVSNLIDSLNESLQSIENVLFVTQELPDDPLNITLTAEINNTYIIPDRAIPALTTFTLPIDAAQGAVVRIIGKGIGGWTLLPGAGQTIEVAGSTAVVSVSSSSRYDVITVEVVTTNTTWVVTSSQTSGFVIV